ncbi:MAG: FkbM family methyltransferase [Ruminococcus sp.]|jgi:FkbM family methyltransferase|nr:FkbM family methyltransferase [Ruminococcus sp.]
MNSSAKSKVIRLTAIDDMLSAYADGAVFEADNWNDMSEVLKSFGLPPENIMFEMTGKLADGTGGVREFRELSKYFGRFYDAQFLAASNSVKISEVLSIGEYGCDREFLDYINIINRLSHEQLEQSLMDDLRVIRRENPEYYNALTEGWRVWYFEENYLYGIGHENNSLITNRVKLLKERTRDLIWLYNNLADALSRRNLTAIVKFYLTWEYKDWVDLSTNYCDVVDTNVFPFYDDEVFVDCGSYIGDTVLQFIKAVNADFKRVYTYDINKNSIKIIKKNLASYPNIDIRHKGTGDVNTEMAEVGVEGAYFGNTLSETPIGGFVEMVKVVRLDDDIDEPISFLKIDCEGMDKETLRGASNHIKHTHPKLHVDSYHKLRDIVDIPRLVREIDPSYSIYLRLPCGEELRKEPRQPLPAFIFI